ncbi:hypothetical protein POM88_012637 [Heracleum sosnowskyi]|uniref:Uncharacterized protein n=1 Tax=Heracleum sosnowskyi TaxID=360622 RepID=A0AAD8IZF2_9APIA|nr:hypothetical protein POM88_012637 [Heracleum sosnowskyi]
MRNTCTRKAQSSTPVQSKNKRKVYDGIDNIDVETLQVASGDEQSEVQRSIEDIGSDVKRIKREIRVSDEFRERFVAKEIEYRTILSGKPIADAMHDIHRRFAQDLTQALGTAFRATGVDIVWPDFGADSVYPPPDTPPEEGGTADD